MDLTGADHGMWWPLIHPLRTENIQSSDRIQHMNPKSLHLAGPFERRDLYHSYGWSLQVCTEQLRWALKYQFWKTWEKENGGDISNNCSKSPSPIFFSLLFYFLILYQFEDHVEYGYFLWMVQDADRVYGKFVMDSEDIWSASLARWSSRRKHSTS